jgi:hypothetical protein
MVDVDGEEEEQPAKRGAAAVGGRDHERVPLLEGLPAAVPEVASLVGWRGARREAPALSKLKEASEGPCLR